MPPGSHAGSLPIRKGLLIPFWGASRRFVIAGHVLLPVQCRMARAALGWSLDKLAETSGVNRKTILRFERDEAATRPNNLEAIRRAFESAGIGFSTDGSVLPPN